MFKIRHFVLALAFFSVSSSLFAQDITFPASPFSYEEEIAAEKPKKHWLTALSVPILFNLGLSTYNRLVIGSAWAKVGKEEITEFYKRKMKWDRDWYWTNFVLHPYQGNMYYSGARASNLNKFESFLITLGGSAMWEWFCETNAPSTNDMVYTSVGSFAVGEMLYRLSLEADTVSPVLGYFVAPVRTYTEFVNGEKSLGSRGNVQEFSLRFVMGTSRYYASTKGYSSTEVFPVFGAAEFYVLYNDPYVHDSNDPYSQFELSMRGGLGVGSGKGSEKWEEKVLYDVRINSSGMLFARTVGHSEQVETSLGIVFDYDFMWHTLIQLSSLSPGLAVNQRIRGRHSAFEWRLHLDGILLGTTDSYYLRRAGVMFDELPTYVFSDYSYGVGAQTVLYGRWISEMGHFVEADVHAYALYDLDSQKQDGISDTGWEFYGMGKLNFELAVSPKINLGLGNELYMKKTAFDEFPNIFQIGYAGTIYARWKLFSR